MEDSTLLDEQQHAVVVAQSGTIDNTCSKECEQVAVITWMDLSKQIFVSLLIHTVVIQAGVNLSFSAVLLPQLRDDKEKQLSVDINAASWIASLATLSLPLGSLFVGTLMDRFGRKKMAIFSVMPFIVSWLMHYWAQSVLVIYAARILAGFASGLTAVGLIYVSEMCHPKYRAMLLNMNSVFVCLGILITCIFGSYLHWRTMSLCYAVLALASALAISALPESPHWLHVFGQQQQQSSKILRWFYSDEATFLQERRRLFNQKTQAESAAKSFTHPTVYKPFLLLLVLFLLQQLSGCYVIIFYAVDVFERIGNNTSNRNNNGMNEYKALVLLGAIRFVAAVVSSIASLKLGRRLLLSSSAFGMLLSVSVAALQLNELVTSVSVLAYVACASLGVLVVPWTLIGELMGVRARGKLGGLLFALTYLIMFGMVKGFPYLVEHVQLRTLFYGLIVVNAGTVCFVLARLPETFGKSFAEIEEGFL